MAEKFTFVQLAHEFIPDKHTINGWYVSEKLDGQRAFWDGGVTRGIPATEVPFANTEKDERLKIPPVATGLWSRYQKVIHAPTWFLDMLPPFPLDGELCIERKSHQKLRSIISKHPANMSETEWKQVKFWVFDSPTAPQMFYYNKEVLDWFKHNKKYQPLHHPDVDPDDPNTQVYSYMYAALRHQLEPFTNLNLLVMPQIKLPYHTDEARRELDRLLISLTDAGAEGLIVRHPGSTYTPKRVPYLLKVKRYYDSEAIVEGYVWGRKTDKGSKLLGLMGAIKVVWTNPDGRVVHFEIGSGFTEAERRMTYINGGNDARIIGCAMPGRVVDKDIHNPNFPIGTQITFQYRELSDGGIPKEGTYLRKRVEE